MSVPTSGLFCWCTASSAMLLCCCGWLQMSVRNCFVRGSVVRYVLVSEAAWALCGHEHASSWLWALFIRCVVLCRLCLQLPAGSVDVELLHDATRREARAAA